MGGVGGEEQVGGGMWRVAARWLVDGTKKGKHKKKGWGGLEPTMERNACGNTKIKKKGRLVD